MNTLALFFTGIALLLISLSIHEFAHAWAANYLGDPTARYRGRLTLDPLAHMDPVGTVMILITAVAGFGIGWGRPVPVVPENFRKNSSWGLALSASAGPISNLLQAVVAAILLQAVRTALPPLPSALVTISQAGMILAGLGALAGGALLAYQWFRRRAQMRPNISGNYSWRVVDSSPASDWWQREETHQQLLRAGLLGVLFFGFLFAPSRLLINAIYINIALALFNLIPLGPLDGSRVLHGLLSQIQARWSFDLLRFLDRIEPHSGIILLGLIFVDSFFPLLSWPLWNSTELIARVLGV